MIAKLACAAMAGLFLLAQPVRAEVLSADAQGFSIALDADTAMTPRQAYDAFIRIGRWWSAAHTYSGDAGNLRLDARPGGCWCEALPGGGFVRHMSVEYAAPGEALRLSGGLGPLQEMGVDGALTVTFKPREGGAKISFRYNVVGRAPNGFAGIAAAVDRVLGEQLTRLAASRPSGARR
jgi:hypothetical protein